jgi:hypothetical protein
MQFDRIARVGLEVEGAWAHAPAGASFHYDGSVSGIAPAEDGRPYRFVGEFVSPPMGTWADVESWLRGAYPDGFNASCGLHVHTSFKSKRDYARLMDAKFWPVFTARMEAWGRFAGLGANHRYWARLSGANGFCRKLHTPEIQVRQARKTGARYTQLNYCFALHKTIECRLFPVFRKPGVSVSAVRELLTTYETFLAEGAAAAGETVTLRVDGLA